MNAPIPQSDELIDLIEASLDDNVTIDLRDPYRPEAVAKWLRTSGGTLGDRAMKAAAAGLIEPSIN